jgi:clusterin-associated protein 1
MSYRELRNFKEIMCTLGYPRLISIENFKVPHFELVADILVWLCHRYDKNMEVLDEIRTEHDRVAFLKSVAEQLLVKARVKLNLKNLYASNGFAVRELLKVATLLYDAHRNASSDAEEADESIPADIGPGHKFSDVRLTRSLAADITKYGSRLHELLGTHAEAKENAARALGKNFDIDHLQRQLHTMNAQVTEQTESLRSMLANLGQDEANLQQRIDKKRAELDRHEKRFASLKAVRPAFMDEYERLEVRERRSRRPYPLPLSPPRPTPRLLHVPTPPPHHPPRCCTQVELGTQYSAYVQSWRNISYLESELDEIEASEEGRIAENDRQLQMMQKRLKEEELRVLRGQTKVDERALDEAIMAGRGQGRNMERPGAAAAGAQYGGGREFDDGGMSAGGGGMYGGMTPLDDDDESDDDDDDLIDDDNGGLSDDDDDDSGGRVEFTHDGGDDDSLGDSDDLGDDLGEEDDDDDF